MKKILTLISLVLIFSMMCVLSSCDVIDVVFGNDTTNSTVNKGGAWENATYLEDREFGEGAKTVQVKVMAEEQSVKFTIKTDASTLGEALLAHNLLAGEQSAYGLYVKTVNGILADYDVDQTYWALYKNGELTSTGVDGVVIADGESYELVKQK